MKIAIPSNDQKNIFQHFGRTEGFLVYEINEQQIKTKEYRVNTFTGHARGKHLKVDQGEQHEHDGDHKHKHSHNHDHGGILVGLADCEVVIAGGMGRKLLVNLQEVDKEIFITKQEDADAAVNDYLANKLAYDNTSVCEH